MTGDNEIDVCLLGVVCLADCVCKHARVSHVQPSVAELAPKAGHPKCEDQQITYTSIESTVNLLNFTFLVTYPRA